LSDSNRETQGRRDSSRPGMRRLYYPILFVVGLAVVYIITQYSSTPQLHSFRLITMDTAVELSFQGPSKREAEQIKNDVLKEMERLEALFSRTLPESDISEVNRQAGIMPVTVSDEVFHVAGEAYAYALISDGAFDPTIAPLIDLWGFLDHDYRVPATAELIETLPLVDYTRLEIATEQQSLFLLDKSMGLELGGIAKGYIVDRVLDTLKVANIEHAFVNAGGDIGLIGTRPDGEQWRIGIRNPREEQNIIAVLPATGGSIVTSGDYERTFSEDGISYHHILDPKTGLPARELISVTIVAGEAITADAFSTAVFVLGPEKGMALIEESEGVEGILITPQMEIILSSGLEGIVELHP
jgi:FAD:protein FMN transferase